MKPSHAAMRYAGTVHVAESQGTVSTGTMVLRSTSPRPCLGMIVVVRMWVSAV
jgi:hypothetical protein